MAVKVRAQVSSRAASVVEARSDSIFAASLSKAATTCSGLSKTRRSGLATPKS
ncbi:hypothetical protein [Granulicella pectinivorans]|uniref:hypothetical protein n=1 Tax=Granulicella pectinivorans TaxID=474950 RepID=UPI00158779D2